MEIWKSVKGYEGLYEVSNFGNVKSVEREVFVKGKSNVVRKCVYKSKILKPFLYQRKKSDNKEKQIVLSKQGKTKTFRVQILVVDSFLGDRKGLEINHINGNSLDNRLENLELITRKENINHAFKNNLIKTSKKVAKIDKEGNFIEIYQSETIACNKNNVSQGKISRSIKRNGTCKGFKWSFV